MHRRNSNSISGPADREPAPSYSAAMVEDTSENDEEEENDQEQEDDPEEIEEIEEEGGGDGAELEGEEEIEEIEEEMEEEEEKEEPRKEKRKQKEFEVFVGGLPRAATEEDLEGVFRNVGDVVEVRLVKDHYTKVNKGFAFVRFATVEQAKRAVTELKHIKVKGKVCGVIKSNDNETLHLGNICASWTKDDLMKKLQSFDLANLEEVILVEDPSSQGKNRGYAFLEFKTHNDAVAACCKLQRREIFLGKDIKADVSFSKTAEPDEETMAQVKSVFVHGLPSTWDEAKLREQFKEFGEIKTVQLASSLPTAKRKDFGFVYFATRQAALDCIEKVNRDGIREGNKKVVVKATLKRPLRRRAPLGLGVKGGYIAKSNDRRKLYPYQRSHFFPDRPSRSHEFIGRVSRDEPRDSGYPPPVRVIRTTTTGRYRPRISTEYITDVPAGRHAPSSYQDVSSTHSHSRVPSDRALYDSQYEHRRLYPDLDRDRVPPSSVSRYGRRSALEMNSYGSLPHDEYSRFLPEDHIGSDRVQYGRREDHIDYDRVQYGRREGPIAYDRVEYARREYRSRCLPGSASSRPYY